MKIILFVQNKDLKFAKKNSRVYIILGRALIFEEKLIPENIVRDRYNMSLIYLKTGLLNFDEVFLIDNSSETAVEIAFVEKGRLVRKIEGCAEWANKILYIVERMMSR